MTKSELERVSEEINGAEQSSLQTEWSRDAWECDRAACDRALIAAREGKSVVVAQDEDGFYFGTERS